MARKILCDAAWTCGACGKYVRLNFETNLDEPEKFHSFIMSTTVYCPFCRAPVALAKTDSPSGQLIEEITGHKTGKKP